MLAVGIALLVTDFSDTLKDFLDAFNDSVYGVAVYALIVLGALIFIVGFLGCCGTCKESSCMLWTFIILMCGLIALEVVLVIFGGLFLDGVKTDLEDQMVDQIRTEYYNETSDDLVSEVWNTIQEEFDCCGARDYRDYSNSTYSATSGEAAPYTCCGNGDGAGLGQCRIEARSGIDPKCEGTEPTVGTWTELNPCGCYTPVADNLEVVGAVFISVTIIAAAVQGALIVLTCCLKSSFNKVGVV